MKAGNLMAEIIAKIYYKDVKEHIDKRIQELKKEFVPRAAVDKMVEEIKSVKAVTNEEIIEHDRKDLINFVNGINQCLMIIDKYTNEESQVEQIKEATKNDLGVDCISRTSALDSINWAYNLSDAYQKIKDLPSVIPQSCEDTISKQALLNATVNKNSIWNKITDSKGENLETIISKLPSVTQIDLNSVIKQDIIDRYKAESEKKRASVLDKIRAEIEDIAFDWQEIDGEHESFMVVDLNEALQIIDKYKAETE